MAKKQKGPTFKDLARIPDELEYKRIEVHGTGLEHKSSNTIYFDCPFCKVEVKAYLWSLCGGGKRCQRCGALFAGASGRAVHFKNRSLAEC